MTDEVLLADYLKTKDQELLAVLCARMQDDLYSLAFQMLHSREDAEDVVQAVWYKLSRLHPRQILSARGFLKRIVKRLSLNRQRDNRSGVRKGLVSLDAMIERHRRLMVGSDDWIDQRDVRRPLIADASNIEVKERDEEVQQALDALSPSEKEAIVLYHSRGLEVSELAEMVGAKETTIRARIRRGVAKLHKALAPDHKENRKRPRLRPVRAINPRSESVVHEFSRMTDAVRAGYNQHPLERALRKGTIYRGLKWSYANAV